MTYIKINEKQYPATIRGNTRDPSWDYRDSKEITLEMSYGDALSTFVDDVQWSIVYQDPSYIDPETQQEITPEPYEYDNSDYSIPGSISDLRNGYVVVKMGKPTYEELYNILMEAATYESNAEN